MAARASPDLQLYNHGPVQVPRSFSGRCTRLTMSTSTGDGGTVLVPTTMNQVTNYEHKCSVPTAVTDVGCAARQEHTPRAHHCTSSSSSARTKWRQGLCTLTHGCSAHSRSWHGVSSQVLMVWQSLMAFAALDRMHANLSVPLVLSSAACMHE